MSRDGSQEAAEGGAGRSEEQAGTMQPDGPGTAAGLSRSAVRGVFWTGGGQVARQVVQIGASIALAQLLVPADFGLLGMGMVFVGVAQLFADFGIGAAIVQSRELDDVTVSSSFWANLASALILAVVICAAAPAIGRFYDDPRVTPIVVVLSLSLVLSGMMSVPLALLYRSMEFGKVARAQVIGSFCGAAVAVTLAGFGFGVWSLVVQPVTGSALTLAALWASAGFRPLLRFSWPAIRPLVGFSAGVLGSDLLNYANRNVDKLVIGKFLGSMSLGYYSLAYQLMLYPLSQVSSVIVKVLFPTLSNLQHDRERFHQAYLKSISAIAMITFPMMLGLLAVSRDFIVVVFGEKWLPMLAVLRVFCLVGLLQSVGTTVGTIYLSTGKTRRMFFLTLCFTPFLIAAYFLGLRWGIEGVAIGYAAVTIAIFYVTLLVAFRIVGLRIGGFHAAVLPPALASGMMFLLVALAVRLLGASPQPALRLGISIAIGVVSYAVLLMVIDRRRFLEIFGLVRRALGRS